MIKPFYFSLRFLFLVFFFACGFLLLRWSSNYWCEQMSEHLVVIRVMKTPQR